MQFEEVFIIHPATTEQASALKAFIKALKIKFEVATNDKPYNHDFVAKIKRSKKEFEQGNFTRIEKDDLQKFLGL